MTSTLTAQNLPTDTVVADHEGHGSTTEPPGLGKSVLIGSLIGMVLALAVVTLGLLAWGATAPESLGVAIFAAFWGGIGFGSMVGGVVFVSNLQAHGD